MRQLPKSSSFSSSSPFINSDCPTDCKNVDFHSQTQRLSSSYSSYKFTFCSWDNCLSEPAGAISCFQSGASLTVTSCLFLSCLSTSFENPDANEEYNGGAICVVEISSLVVSSSSFIKCCAPQTNNDNRGSGGIFAYGIITTISLSSSQFISCFTGTSAAGAYFESIKTSDVGPQTVNNCRFVNCKAEGNTPDGGGLTFRNPAYTMGCSNSLFYKYSATTNAGGGLDFTFNENSDDYPIRFCFFKENDATLGHDIRLRGYSSTNPNPLLHCFSSSKEKIVYITEGDCYNDNWLPLTNINVDLPQHETIHSALSSHKNSSHCAFILSINS